MGTRITVEDVIEVRRVDGTFKVRAKKRWNTGPELSEEDKVEIICELE